MLIATGGNAYQLEKFRFQLKRIVALDFLYHFFNVVPAKFAVVFAAAQGLGVRRGGQREAGVFIGLGQRDADDGDGLLDEFAGALAGQFVTHFDKGVFVFAEARPSPPVW